MKAEDLMIGDWVYYSYANLFVTKVIDVCSHYGDEHFIRCKRDEKDNLYKQDQLEDFNVGILRPIPITKEILEKNSFLKVEGIVYPSHSVGISFLYRDTPEGLRIFVQNACVGGPTCTMIKTCKYVHEVQHMIKMCDIEKTFVL